MRKVLVLLFAAISLHVTVGDVSVNDYIFWKKADIIAWHTFFPSRDIEEERKTNQAAITAIQNVTSGLNDSLSSMVSFQEMELKTAILEMQGTDAEGCINGISNFMPNAISDEIDSCMDCMADAQSKLIRINSTWTKAKNTYIAAYVRALKGIDVCAKTYPNKDSIDRLKSCVESMNNNYFTASGKVQSAMYPSPSMSYFQNTILQCATTAALNVAVKGWKFLSLLVECSKLSGNIDPAAYADDLSKWKGYNDTLQNQISSSQALNYEQVWSVEIEMGSYWNLQKEALEKYVIDSRGLVFYVNNNYLALKDYYDTVTAVALDNPTQQECTNAAKAQLDAIANNGALDSLACDVSIVNKTKVMMSNVVEDFQTLNTKMPSLGNAALLECLSRGYIFAPNTIADCFNLTYSGFNVDHFDLRDDIRTKVAILQNYASSFYNGTSFPCGGSSKERLLLGGDKALYALKRCLYIGSGTTYEVSTPTPTTTSSWNVSTTTTPEE